MGGSGGGIILVNPEGDQLEYAAKFLFRASNNEAEYKALIRGMRLAIRLEVHHLIAYSELKIISQQLGGTFEAREERIKRYVQKVKNLSSKIDKFELHHIRGQKIAGVIVHIRSLAY